MKIIGKLERVPTWVLFIAHFASYLLMMASAVLNDGASYSIYQMLSFIFLPIHMSAVMMVLMGLGKYRLGKVRPGLSKWAAIMAMVVAVYFFYGTALRDILALLMGWHYVFSVHDRVYYSILACMTSMAVLSMWIFWREMNNDLAIQEASLDMRRYERYRKYTREFYLLFYLGYILYVAAFLGLVIETRGLANFFSTLSSSFFFFFALFFLPGILGGLLFTLKLVLRKMGRGFRFFRTLGQMSFVLPIITVFTFIVFPVWGKGASDDDIARVMTSWLGILIMVPPAYILYKSEIGLLPVDDDKPEGGGEKEETLEPSVKMEL